MTFSGRVAAQGTQDVRYVTERCVFHLTQTGLDLIEIAPGVDMTFTALPRYSVLQVSRDAGVPVVLGAAILLLLGLLPAMYTSRRRLWVRVRAVEGGTEVEAEVEVGGFALQRKPQFEEEFARTVRALVEAAGGEAPARETVGTR